jgi:hypothetical protein
MTANNENNIQVLSLNTYNIVLEFKHVLDLDKKHNRDDWKGGNCNGNINCYN